MKPCPICGGNAGLSHSWDADGCYWSHVECTACGLRTRGQWTTSRQEASSECYEEVREAWNSRPAAQQDAPTDARTAFETFALLKYGKTYEDVCERRADGEYKNGLMRDLWAAWQAACTLDAPAQDAERERDALCSAIDYSIKKGDVVRHPTWTLTELRVVDVNWALQAVAVQLGQGGIVVWPAAGLKKVDAARAQRAGKGE